MLTVSVLQNALEVGFIYALVALALFLSYSILDIADLTTDGSFTLGCAVSAAVCIAGHPLLALCSAVLAGALAGFVTAFLQTRLGVPSILAGIVTNTGLYTVNLAVMGFSSNLPLFNRETLFTLSKDTLGRLIGPWHKLAVAAAITLLLSAALVWFLGTRLGISIRATGDNPDMVRASSINTTLMITIGLCLANAMTALSGAVLAQYNKSADINLGTGMVVIGLASLIIGQTLVGRGSMVRSVAAVLTGSILYRFVIAVALKVNIPAECLKLVSAVIVGFAIALPTLKEYAAFRQKRSALRSERGVR